MVIESFKEFLINGYFKNIPFGIKRKDFVALLGETECVIPGDDDRFPGVYQYGYTEFYFEEKSYDDELLGVMVQPVVGPCENHNLTIDFDVWDENLTLDKAKEYFSRYQIPYQETSDEYDPDDIQLITQSGIKIYFSLDYKDEPPIFKFFELGRFQY